LPVKKSSDRVQPIDLVARLIAYRTPSSGGKDSETMAKLNHQKRHRPRPVATRRRRATLQRVEERRSQRDLERWRRST